MAAAAGVILLLETHQVIHSGPCLSDTSPTTIRLLELVTAPTCASPSRPRSSAKRPKTAHDSSGASRTKSRRTTGSAPPKAPGASSRSWTPAIWTSGRYRNILREEGFDGWISIEHANHHPWEETAAHEIAYLRRLLAEG